VHCILTRITITKQSSKSRYFQLLRMAIPNLMRYPVLDTNKAGYAGSADPTNPSKSTSTWQNNFNVPSTRVGLASLQEHDCSWDLAAWFTTYSISGQQFAANYISIRTINLYSIHLLNASSSRSASSRSPVVGVCLPLLFAMSTPWITVPVRPRFAR